MFRFFGRRVARQVCKSYQPRLEWLEGRSLLSGDCIPAPPGLVGWWPGDGNAKDIVGGNDGTLENGATFAPAMVDEAFRFDGINDLVRVNDAANLDITGPLTIEAWVKVNSFSPTHPDVILWKGNNFGHDISTPYALAVNNQDGRLFATIGNGTAADLIYSAGPLSPGSFAHIAVTATGSTIRLYVDGQISSQLDQTVTPYNSPYHLQIGSLATSPLNTLNGLVDELSIYNRALTTEEIQAIYNAGSSGKCKTNVDLTPTSFAWNAIDGGVDFGYKVTGADLTQDTTAALYWASGTAFADAIGGPVYDTPIEQQVGEYGPFFVPNAVLGTPPPNATRLLLIVDPPSASRPNGDIMEANEDNNILAIPLYALDEPDEIVPPVIAQRVDRIAAEYYRLTGTVFVITDGLRTPLEMAQILLPDLANPQDRRRLYQQVYDRRVHHLLDEIVVAYDSHGTDSLRLAAMTETIHRQIARGQYLSDHLRGHAIDIRSRGPGAVNIGALRRAIQRLGIQVEIGDETARPRPHWHLEFP
jgi:hypothetical protein